MAETTGDKTAAQNLLRKAYRRVGLVITPDWSGAGTQLDWKVAFDLDKLASYCINLSQAADSGRIWAGFPWAIHGHQPGCGLQPSASLSHPTTTSITTTEPVFVTPPHLNPAGQAEGHLPESGSDKSWSRAQQPDSDTPVSLWADELEDTPRPVSRVNTAVLSSQRETTCETQSIVSMQVIGRTQWKPGFQESSLINRIWRVLGGAAAGLEGRRQSLLPLREGTARPSWWLQAGSRRESWQRRRESQPAPRLLQTHWKQPMEPPPRKLRLHRTFLIWLFLTACKNCHQWQIPRISPKHLKSFTAF